jgi:hypothetical protein
MTTKATTKSTVNPEELPPKDDSRRITVWLYIRNDCGKNKYGVRTNGAWLENELVHQNKLPCNSDKKYRIFYRVLNGQKQGAIFLC